MTEARPLSPPVTLAEAIDLVQRMFDSLDYTRTTITITPGRALVTSRLGGWATNKNLAERAKSDLIGHLGTDGIRHARNGRRRTWGVYESYAGRLTGAACGVEWNDEEGFKARLLGAAWKVSTQWGRQGLELVIREPNGTQRIELAA